MLKITSLIMRIRVLIPPLSLFIQVQLDPTYRAMFNKTGEQNVR